MKKKTRHCSLRMYTGKMLDLKDIMDKGRSDIVEESTGSTVLYEWSIATGLELR